MRHPRTLTSQRGSPPDGLEASVAIITVPSVRCVGIPSRPFPFIGPPFHSKSKSLNTGHRRGVSLCGLSLKSQSAESGCGGRRPRRPPPCGRSRARWSGCRCGRRICAPRAKHSHNAPQVSDYPASVAPPTIAVAALLGLARWCRQRSDVPGDPSCGDRHPRQRPPARRSGEEPGQTDPAPLGPTHPGPAGPPGSPRWTVTRPALTDGRPSGGQP